MCEHRCILRILTSRFPILLKILWEMEELKILMKFHFELLNYLNENLEILEKFTASRAIDTTNIRQNIFLIYLFLKNESE